MTKQLIIIFFLAFYIGHSQDAPAEVKEGNVNGVVVNTSNDFPLGNVHIVNLTRVTGTITDSKGVFNIRAAVNDTLYFSFIGFKSLKVRVTNDMLKFEGTRIGLTELAYALEEVILRPYQLTGYLEIDAKNIPVNDSYRYSISGLSKGYEAGNPKKVSKILGAIFDPATSLNKIFGKRPKQLRKLRKMKEDDKIRDLLASKFDRETLVALIQVDRQDIDVILRNCNYSDQFINSANDLQILDAISSCYEEYKILSREN